MANNRMFIQCKGCGAEFTLAKHFASAWTMAKPEADFDAFFREHEHCGKDVDFTLTFEDPGVKP